ncbi:MAG: YceD family protein [Betaproteobacteria bacterium]|nr:YceD family protein [Betaproteobacteria bacterium]
MDLWRFAREGGFLEGYLKLAAFARLEDGLAETEGEIFFRVQGEMVDAPGGHGKARLSVAASGELPLVCQRCLSPARVKFRIESRLELVDEQSALTREELEDATLDFLPLASGKAGFRSAEELVEDEILLALPSAPRHDDCALPDAQEIEAPHPFAALAALKSRVRS